MPGQGHDLRLYQLELNPTDAGPGEEVSIRAEVRNEGLIGEVQVMGCAFERNRGVPGALAVYNASGLQVADSTFLNNESFGDGGAVNSDTSATFDGCLFVENQSTVHGGAIRIAGATNPLATVDNCRFVGNGSFLYAGPDMRIQAIYMWGGTISNSVFLENGRGVGADFVVYAEQTPLASSCTFVGNLGRVARRFNFRDCY